jgi:hypothetical protein
LTITTEAPTTTAPAFKVGDAVQINNPFCDPAWNVIGDVLSDEGVDQRTGKRWYEVQPRVGRYATGIHGGFEEAHLEPIPADAITVHDVEGLLALPVGTRLIDSVGDVAEIREKDGKHTFDWVELGVASYRPSLHFYIEALVPSGHEPYIIQNPSVLDAECPKAEVGDKVRLLKNGYGAPVGTEGTVYHVEIRQDGRALYDATGFGSARDLCLYASEFEVVHEVVPEVEEYVIHDREGMDALPVGAKVERLGDTPGDRYDKVEAGLWTHEAGLGARFTRFERFEFPFRLVNPEVLDEPVQTLVFAEGTELELIDGSAKNARPGSRAVVVKDCFEGDEYVNVRWTNVITSSSFGQMDGDYFPSGFEVAEPSPVTEEPLADWELALLESSPSEVEAPVFVMDGEGMEALPVGSVLRSTTGTLRVRVIDGYVVPTLPRLVMDYAAVRSAGPLEVLFTPDAA